MNRLTKTAATTIVAAGLAAGLYTQSSLIQVHSQFALDMAPWNDPQFFLDAQGRQVAMFDDDGKAGYWRRVTVEELLSDATIWINGMPFGFNADGSIDGQSMQGAGLEVYPNATEGNYRAWITPPVWVKFTAQDERIAQTTGDGTATSSDYWIYFRTCDPIDTFSIPNRPTPIQPQQPYQVRLEAHDPETGQWTEADRAFLRPDMHQNVTMKPGTYRIYFAGEDQLGILGSWHGPIEIVVSGGPCDG